MPQNQIALWNPEFPSAPLIRLAEGTTLLGRDMTCTIVLTDSSVSRFHAELVVNGEGVTVRDLGSRNGTYVDGKRIESSPLRGQGLHLGCVRFQLEMTGPSQGEADADLETCSVSDVFDAAATGLDQMPLSAAERRVFDLILPGLAEKEIAGRLGISRHTVHTHMRKIYEAFGVRSRAELLARFIPPLKNQ